MLFYVQAPKSQKYLNQLTRITAPDIDNLLKATLYSIFKDFDVKDSRGVMIANTKFQEMGNPRTEIVLRGLNDEENKFR